MGSAMEYRLPLQRRADENLQSTTLQAMGAAEMSGRSRGETRSATCVSPAAAATAAGGVG